MAASYGKVSAVQVILGVEGVDLHLSFWGPTWIAHTIASWQFADAPPLAVSGAAVSASLAAPACSTGDQLLELPADLHRRDVVLHRDQSPQLIRKIRNRLQMADLPI